MLNFVWLLNGSIKKRRLKKLKKQNAPNVEVIIGILPMPQNIKPTNKGIMKYPKSKLFEQLADIEHQRWADWQKWCHKILRENCPSPELEKVLERWDKQIATSYNDLSEKEKDSDREQVMRYWNLIN